MSGGVLFIHGGHDHARRRFREEAEADWSQGLSLVLEKYGYLAVTERDATALADRELWQEHACVLIARLPEEAWTPEAVEMVQSGQTQVLLEAPLPPALMSALGATRTGRLAGEMTITSASAELSRTANAHGMGCGGRVGPVKTRVLPRSDAQDWANLDGVPLEPSQAEVWRKPGWEVEEWAVADGTAVLANWTTQAGLRHPAVVRRGHLVALSSSLLAYLVRCHTSEPWAGGGEYRSSYRSTGIEAMLLGLIDDLHARAGRVRARVLPWPRGASWAFHVRHDFDRPMAADAVQDVLDRHRRVGTAATWYWRSRHLGQGLSRLSRLLRTGDPSATTAVRLVAEAAGHEVAHHTEELWTNADRERRVIERAIGRPLLGTSAHGDRTCFRFQGAPNILWAEHQGLLYTELIQHAHLHPHRFPALAADGTVEQLAVVCLPHHESFDNTVQEGDNDPDRVLESAERFRRAGGLLQVLNHPDIHLDDLFTTLAEVPREGRLNWTAARAAAWWRRTHTRDAVTVAVAADGRVQVTAVEAVENLALELLAPDGERTVVVLDAPAGATVAAGGTP